MRFRCSIEKECIVYIEQLKKLDDSVYDVYVDFRTEKDVRIFMPNIVHQEKYILYLSNVQTNKRLRVGCYYKLNLNLLNEIQIKNDGVDSDVVWREYDCNSMPYPLDEATELLQSHKPLDPDDLYVSGMMNLNFSFDISSDNLRVCVNDVNQGNWNELYSGKSVKIVYDIGTLMHESKSRVRGMVDKHICTYKRDKPLLVISHWDLDHCCCLKSMTPQEIGECFSGLVCTDVLKSLTSQKIFKVLREALGESNVCLISPSYRIRGDMRFLFRKSVAGFYVGRKSSSINISGICVFVQGENKSVSFIGDIKLRQAKEVFESENKYNEALDKKQHILLAPHHGGDCEKRYRDYVSPISTVIISVGRDNHYGHPSESMLKYLRSISRQIKRTDMNGDVEMDL